MIGSSLDDGPLRREVYAVARPFSCLVMLAIGAVSIVALYVAHEIFVPLALAILLSFALGPLVMLLRRWHCGRVPSVVVAVSLAFLLAGGVGVLIGSQLTQLAEELPHYQANITGKIHWLQGATTGSGARSA